MSYFDKFINDLTKREKKEKEATNVSQQELLEQCTPFCWAQGSEKTLSSKNLQQ